MLRLSRRFAAAAVRHSHVCALHARAGLRSARGARERAVCEFCNGCAAWRDMARRCVAWRGVAWRGVAW
eukprot:1785962-Lingulodinium_polyedra.AAC.1